MVTMITKPHLDFLLLMKMVTMVTKKMKILQKSHHSKKINTSLLSLLDLETSKAHLSREVYSRIVLLALEILNFFALCVTKIAISEYYLLSA